MDGSEVVWAGHGCYSCRYKDTIALSKETQNMQFEDPASALESLSARIIAIRDSL